MLKVVEFIRENLTDWVEKLKEEYNINAKFDSDYVCLKYSIGADFTNELVRECRGLILKTTEDFKPVCVPFWKFCNYGEAGADEIDWNSVRVQTKVDGSNIKVWYDGEKWRVSTMGTVDAFKTPIESPLSEEGFIKTTFGELFAEALPIDFSFLKLNENYTYIFELVSPYNKIVVDYDKPDVYHIGTRDNTTFEELDVDIGIKKPEEWPLKTLDDCIDFVSKFKGEQEGFVAVDKYWRRVKIKSPFYVAASRSIGKTLSINRILNIYIEGEMEEFLNYFPEVKPSFDLIINAEKAICEEIEREYETVKDIKNRKELALKTKDYKWKAYHFKKFEDKDIKSIDFLRSLFGYRDKILDLIRGKIK